MKEGKISWACCKNGKRNGKRNAAKILGLKNSEPKGKTVRLKSGLPSMRDADEDRKES